MMDQVANSTASMPETSTGGQPGVSDPYDPAYIYRSIYGSKMKGHRQVWPDIDLSELCSINPDCVGWIHVDGCPVNYPVVKQHFDRSYYSAVDDRLIVCSTCAFCQEPYDKFEAFAVIEEECMYETGIGAYPKPIADREGIC